MTREEYKQRNLKSFKPLTGKQITEKMNHYFKKFVVPDMKAEIKTAKPTVDASVVSDMYSVFDGKLGV